MPSAHYKSSIPHFRLIFGPWGNVRPQWVGQEPVVIAEGPL